MTHPALHFAKYLVAESWSDEDGPSLASINATFRSMRVLPLSHDGYDELIIGFDPPPGFDFDDHSHDPTREFMVAERISLLWEKDRDGERVLSTLLPLYAVRDRIDILLMGNVSSESIARWATRWATALPHIGHSGAMTPRMIDWYRHYVHNVWVCSPAEWEALLRGHPREDAMLAALYGGADQARFWAGLDLKLKDKKAPLRDALAQAHLRLLSLRSKPTTKGVIDMEVKLAQAIEKLHSRLYGDDNTDAMDRLREFAQAVKLTTVDPKIPSIDQVVGEHGSWSGQPIPRAESSSPKGSSSKVSSTVCSDQPTG